jgi:uncharacterized RmlC-like cupin family protein
LFTLENSTGAHCKRLARERLPAVAPQLGVETTLWGGLFEVKQGARTGIRHHGDQQTIAYVLSGTCKVR